VTAKRLAALLLGIVALGSSALAAAPAGAATARRADAFVESIGVNVHLGYGGTPYTESLPTLEQRLGELGVHHVRTGFLPGSATIDKGVEELGALGIGSTLIMGVPTEPSGALPQMLGDIEALPAGSVDAVEGPNEWSTSGHTNWKAELVAYQERLFREVNERSALAALPVLGPSIVGGGQAALGNISAYLDDGNIHSYPEGDVPENKLSYYLKQAALNSGTKPIEATETGYTNATAWTPSGPGENKPISEAAAAVYLPRLYLEYWSHGITRTFDYELVDEYENAALDEREDHFGLLRHDLTLKPAASALANLTAILADPGPAVAPGSLEYTLAGGEAKVRSVLMEKNDGTFYLALWRMQSIWNPDTKQPIAAAPEPLEVSFTAGPVDWSAYEPTTSAAPVSSGGPSQTVTVPVGAGVTILRLEATDEAPSTEPEPGAPGGSPAAVPPATAPIVPQVLPLPQWSAPRCVVPPLAGRRLAAAKASVRGAGCLPRAVAVLTHPRRPSAAERAQRVTRSTPTAGTVLDAGATVKLFYKRPAPR
jgi:hypothetical protein